MKQVLLFMIFIVLQTSSILGQNNRFEVDINKTFKLNVDSIEFRTVETKHYTQLYNLIHYTISNISEDTLIFYTNGCLSYNEYLLEINDSIFYPNKLECCCRARLQKYHELKPNESFFTIEEVSEDFSNIKTEISNIKLTIPVEVWTPYIFRVDGRQGMKNIEYLISKGNVLIVENEIIILSKRQQRKLNRKKRKE